jgi:putative ABC transport system permease protein
MTFTQDLRFALRMFTKNPGLSAVIVITLAFGIGANTTVFTLVNAVLFRGLPFEKPEQIMHIAAQNRERGDRRSGVSYPDYADFKANAKSFQDLAAFQSTTINVSDAAGVPERYRGTRVTVNTFGLIGQKMAVGRDFLPEDGKPNAIPVAIIGYGTWKNRYGAKPDVIGKIIRANEIATTIVGVMPEGVKFPSNSDMWTPLIPDAPLERRDSRGLGVFGRLQDGATRETGQAELNTIAEQLAKSYPVTNKGFATYMEPYNDAFNGGSIRIMFLALLGAVGFVLLISCANVANLLLSRSISRNREMSIRAALGASRWRIVRQLLTESVLLGTAGGVLGLLIATQGVRAFDLAVADVGKPYWITFKFDWTVFAYLAVICLLTAVISGLFPAIQSARADVNSPLKEGGRGTAGRSRGWMSGALVVTELALSVVLLAGAGLMIRSFIAFYNLHSGLDAEKLMTMRLNLPAAKYPKPETRTQFVENLDARLKSVPGIAAAALASNSPNEGSFRWPFQIEGQAPMEREKRPNLAGLTITPRYFDALGVPLLNGRAFVETDGLPGKESVIVNQRFAARHWPKQDPLGKRIRLFREDREQPWMTVVGVSRDIRQNSPNEAEVDPLIYVPHRQDPSSSMVILARGNVAAASLTSALRRQVQAVDPDLPVFDVRTLQELIHRQRWAYSVFGTLFAVFAFMALVLSAIGIFGVISYSVGQRTQEIGVRVALGAGTKDIMRLVMSRGVIQLAIGVTIGLAGAYGLTRVLSTLLVQVSATDPLTFTLVTALLVITGVFACLLPARKALRVPPTTALRYE